VLASSFVEELEVIGTVKEETREPEHVEVIKLRRCVKNGFSNLTKEQIGQD